MKIQARGAYGSGLTCRFIRDCSLATFTWFTGFTGFQEPNKFRPRLQVAPERKICDGKLSIDTDIAQNDNFGAFRVTA